MFRRVLLFLAAATFASAAGSWSAVSQTATTNNLWSIAYGGGTLIAAGEQGTILAYNYTDDVWAAIPSGTSVWLVGVGYGNGRFVVVGDQGTILTSDDSGQTWTPRVSGVTARLNAAAYGGGRWLVVGEHGTVLTSLDGTTWTSLPALGTGFLRALAYGQGMFLVGGAGGGLWSSTDGTTFTPVPLITTSNIESAAISATRFWISGSNGLRATATQLSQWVFASDPNSLTYRGAAAESTDAADFVADAGAVSYSGGAWNLMYPPPGFLATAIAQGQNEIIAVGFNGGIARAGINAGPVIVSDSNVPLYGSDVTLTVTGTVPASTTLQWYHNGTLIRGATGRTLALSHVTSADSGNYEIRPNPDPHLLIPLFVLTVMPGGRPDIVDHGFVSALPGAPSSVVVQPDGKILVAGNFSVTLPGGVTTGLARLNPDGTLDSGFRAGTGIPALSSVYAIHLLSDGRMYIRGNFTSIDGIARNGLARLQPDGSVDTAFAPTDPGLDAPAGSAISNADQLYVQTRSGSIVRLTPTGAVDSAFSTVSGNLAAIDASGRLYVDQNWKSLVRVLPDGSIDPSFAYTGIIYGPVMYVLPTSTGVYVATYNYTKFGGFYTFRRVMLNGTVDAAYQSPPAVGAVYGTSYWFWTSDGGQWQPQRSGVGIRAVYYRPDGTPDSSVYAAATDLSNFQIVATAPDRSLLAIASLDQPIDRRALVRIRPLTGAVGRLSNLSVRNYVSSEPLIAGVVASGSGSTTAVVRAVGPGLADYGVTDFLRDPEFNLVRDGATVANNDDWAASLAPRFVAVGAFALQPGSKDAAVEATISPGAYTTVLSPKADDVGTALVEVYQSANVPTATTRLINVSARGRVDSSHPLIVGFAITGDVPLTVLIRGAGPALGVAPFNLANVLPDPAITLYRNTTALADSRVTDGTASITATRVGAFSFPVGSKDSAMVVTLAPGSYTAVINSADQHSGVALGEVYEVGP